MARQCIWIYINVKAELPQPSLGYADVMSTCWQTRRNCPSNSAKRAVPHSQAGGGDGGSVSPSSHTSANRNTVLDSPVAHQVIRAEFTDWAPQQEHVQQGVLQFGLSQGPSTRTKNKNQVQEQFQGTITGTKYNE